MKKLNLLTGLLVASTLLASSSLVYAEHDCWMDQPCNISSGFGETSDILIHTSDGERYVCDIKSLDKNHALNVSVSGAGDFSFPEIQISDIPFDPPVQFKFQGKFAKPETDGKIVITNRSQMAGGEVICHRE